MTIIEEPIGLDQLAKDVRNAAVSLSVRQARYLVDMYYTLQEHRLALTGQARSMTADEEPHEAVTFFGRQMSMLEKQVLQVLDYWSSQQELGQWARSQKGIGPVLSAALLAEIDVTAVATAGNVWSFAGLEPTATWGKGEKRPWNARLKVICWKIGESFMKVSGRDDAFYGKIYAQRKQFEIERNGQVQQLPDSSLPSDQDELTETMVTIDDELRTAYLIEGHWYVGGNAKSAQQALAKRRIGKETASYKAYKVGKIPEGQILARAKRYAVKLFLAHYLEVGRKQLGLEVPLPYPIAYLGHTDIIPPPQ